MVKNRLIVYFLVVVCLVFMLQSSARAQFSMLFRNPLIGEKAPDVILNDLNGNNTTISKIRNGNKAILFFWATWCPHCRAAIKELNEDKQEYVNNGISLILINVGENRNLVNKYITNNKINLTVLLDSRKSLLEPYGINGLPTFFFIDKDGTVLDSSYKIPDDYKDIFVKK